MLRRHFLALLGATPAALAFPHILRAATRPSIKIATGVTPPSIYNIWLHVAYDRGFLSDNGVDVTEFIQLRGGPLAIQAIAANEADLAPADPEGLLAAVVAGHPIRAVAAPGSRLAYMVVGFLVLQAGREVSANSDQATPVSRTPTPDRR